jgi:hypothetical protein
MLNVGKGGIIDKQVIGRTIGETLSNGEKGSGFRVQGSAKKRKVANVREPLRCQLAFPTGTFLSRNLNPEP